MTTVDAATVKTYRETHGVSLQDARRIITKRNRAERLDQIERDLGRWGVSQTRQAVRDLLQIVREMNQ